MDGRRRYYNYPDEEYFQSLGGPYYNPYSSAPIDIGMTLRQNLAQIAAYKQYEREQEEKRKQQEFENFIKTIQLSSPEKTPKALTAEEEMWGQLTPEEKMGAARKKYLPEKEPERPEKPSAFQERMAFYQSVGYTPQQIAKIELEGKPEKEKPKEKEKKAELPEYDVKTLEIKEYYNRARQKARYQFQQSIDKLDLDTKEGRRGREILDGDFKKLMSHMDAGELNELNNLAQAWKRMPYNIENFEKYVTKTGRQEPPALPAGMTQAVLDEARKMRGDLSEDEIIRRWARAHPKK